MSEHTVSFAVVGAGTIGEVHARAIAEAPDAELALVVDADPGAAAKLAGAHGAEHTGDVEGYLARDGIDAVALCTPSGAHADAAVAALRAGRHVLIEKPIDVTLAAADRVIAAERESGRVVSVISQHRFDRATERLSESIAAGRLGRLTSANASCAWWRGQSYYDSGDWRGSWRLDGGGAVMNQTVHTIDLMLALLGEPVEVFAYTACLAHERIEVEDTAVAVVRFAGGALGTIHGTTAAYPGLDASLRVMGTGGSAVISDDELVYLHESDATAAAPAGDEPRNQVTEADRRTEAERGLGWAHARQLAEFTTAIRTGGPIRSGTRQARDALATIVGMYRSAETGAPVALGSAAEGAQDAH